MDASASYKGYKADFNRFFTISKEASNNLKEIHRMMTEVHEETSILWVPGTPVKNIAAKVLKAYKRAGIRPFSDKIFIGHNLGYNQVERPWYGSWSNPNLRFSRTWQSQSSTSSPQA